MTLGDSSKSSAQHYLVTLLRRCARAPVRHVETASLATAPALDADWWQDGPDDFIGAPATTTAGSDDAFADVRGARVWTEAAHDPECVADDALLAGQLLEAASAWTDAETRGLAQGDEALGRADVGALHHLFLLLAALDGVVVSDSGPVAAAVVAGLRSDDVPTQRLALDVVRKFDLRLLQCDVAGLLEAPGRLGHDGIEATLDVLADLADGRAVRRLEEVLATHGPQLSQHQAWRARHIVQVIRRAGRR